MAYPEKLLSEGESVVLDLHPHWKVVVLPVVELLATLGLAGFLLAVVDDSIGRYAILGVAALLVLVFFLWPLLKWRTTHFVVTTERVVMRTGVLARSGRDIPLQRVNDVSFQHTFFERLLRCGKLTIESAGEHGQVVLPEVPHVEWVQREVYKCVEEEVRRQGGPWREQVADPGS